MKFRSELAQMPVEEIVKELSKKVRVLTWKEEVEFFEKLHKEPPKTTVISWCVCKKFLIKSKKENDEKVLDIQAWVNLFKWTDKLSKEEFLRYLVENFFGEEVTLCTKKAWSNLPDVIKQAFKLIEEETTE